MLTIEIKREEDGRWIAEVPDLPGVMTYGETADEARHKAEALALRVLADRLENGEKFLPSTSFSEPRESVAEFAGPPRFCCLVTKRLGSETPVGFAPSS